MKKIISLLLFSILFFQLVAQEGIIKGRVYDEKTNEPLEFATVLIEGTQISSTTDLDGNFIFTGVEPGFLRIEVRYVGYENVSSSEIQVQGNQTTFINIPVKPSTKLLNKVVVRRKLNAKKIESPLSFIQAGARDIEKTPGVNRDISKLVQTLPGVGITDPQRNDLVVRGGGPSENVFYLDGVEIPVINHFTTQGSSGGAVGIINPDFVNYVNFYTGAFPASKPNALSSVMEINMREGSKDRIHTKVAVGASDAGITLDGPIGKNSTFIVSARQSYLQFLFDAIGLPFLPTYNDFQIKYKVDLNRKNQLTFIGLGAIDNMRLNLTLDEPTEAQNYLLSYLPNYDQWNYTVGAVYKHFGDNKYSTWVLSRNMLRNKSYKYINNDDSQPKTLDFLSDESENKLRFEQTMPDGFFQTQWGAGVKHGRYTNNTRRDIFIDGNVINQDYQTKIHVFFYQAFVQLSKEIFEEKLKLSLGMNVVGNNFNANMANPLNQFSPRLSATYALNEKWNINANIGRYAASPAYTILGFADNDGNLVNKNEKLKYIISNQAVGGLEFMPSDKMRLTVEGFFKKYNNYPLSVNEGLSIASKGDDYGQVGDEEIISEGIGRAYGVEFLLKLINFENLNLSTTYTLFKSEFTDKDGVYWPSSWDTGSIFNLLGSYTFLKSWTVGARWRMVGGQPYSPIDLEISSLRSAWNVKNQPYPDYNNFNSLNLKPSHQLDIRIDKEFYFKKWLLNLYIDVQNVYNFKAENVPIYTNLDKNGNEMIDSSDNSKYELRKIDNFGGNILPTLGIIVKF